MEQEKRNGRHTERGNIARVTLRVLGFLLSNWLLRELELRDWENFTGRLYARFFFKEKKSLNRIALEFVQNRKRRQRQR